MIEELIKNVEEKMKKAIDATARELSTIRTGRANPTILERVKVSAYNQLMPLNQLATISSPEPRALLIQPWDKSIIADIEKAIIKSDLNLTPINLGNVIRLNIPPLTEERRKELVKIVKKEIEQGKVSIRNIRRDANEEVKKMEKNKDISEDESRRTLDKIQKATDKYIEEMDRLLERKEKEIMEV